MKITGNEPYYPIVENNDSQSITTGVTIRQHFAELAMAGLCADNNVCAGGVAQLAVKITDLLIEELNKTEKE